MFTMSFQRSISLWLPAALLMLFIYGAWQFNRFTRETKSLLSADGELTALNAFREQLLSLQISQLGKTDTPDPRRLVSLSDSYKKFLIQTDLSSAPRTVARLDTQFQRYNALLLEKSQKPPLTRAQNDSLMRLSIGIFSFLKKIGERHSERVRQREAALEAARAAFVYRSAAALGIFLALAVAGLLSYRNTKKRRAQQLKRSLKSLHDGSRFVEFNDDGDDLFAALAIEFNHIKKKLDAYESYPLPELILDRPAAGKIASPINMGLMVLDVHGRDILRFSPSVPRLLQVPPADSSPPLPLKLFMNNSPYASLLPDFTAENGKSVILNPGKGGLLALFTFKYSDGLYVIVQDLSFLKIQELARKEFIAYISHEIKTPLTSMSLAVHNLQKEALAPERLREISLLLKDDLFRLKQFTGNMLLIAMLEDENDRPAMEATDLSQLLGEVSDTLSPMVGRKGISVVLTAPGNMRAIVNPVLIRHALINITHNALRFAPAGSQIDLRLTEEKRQILIEVRDRGAGLEEELINTLNEGRLNYSLREEHNEAHFGLGFYLSARIAGRHGGRLSIRNSNPGACVTLRLPREEDNE